MTIIKSGFIAAASALCLAAPVFADGPQTARTVIEEVMEAAPIPAVSVAVHGADGPLYAEAFGQASLELQAPAATAHRFRLGSVAKILTASLAARLADQGVVDLDAPIATYMPNLPEAHRQTSLRQLLGHQGGVRHYGAADYNPMAPGSIIDLRVYPTTQSALALFIEDPLIGEPGGQYAYTTFGYTLIGAVLEAASGRSFLELLEAEISAPLGLSSVAEDHMFNLRGGRVSYYDVGAQYRQQFDPTVEDEVVNALRNNPAYKVPGGGLIATPADLARFGAAHFGPGLVGAHYEQLFTLQTTAGGEATPVGLGWRVDRDEAGRLRYHHAGNQQGARAVVLVYPEQRISVSVMTNLGGTPRDILGVAAGVAEGFLAD